MTVQTEKLPDHRDKVILVGTTVRRNLSALTAYLQGLDWQILLPRTRVHYCFVADFSPQQGDAESYLREWTALRGGEVLRGVPSNHQDFTDQHPSAHQWSGSAMARVGQNKNRIIRRALELKADAIWFLDSDVIADTTTLLSLLSVERPIVCGNYWTVWGKDPSETARIFSGPVVWLQHPYQLSGRGMEDWEFRAKLIRKEVTQVWGQGACSLIDRKVIEAGINFDYVPEVPREGLMGGEDRHFCIRAERAHIPMFADPWPDQFHVYRPEDEAQIPAMLKRLGTKHPTRPILGDWVSLKLHALEPIPTPRGLQHFAPYPVRGRLGSIALLPELEEAVYGMTTGQSITVRAHCPVSHPLAYFRGRARLFRLSLVDVKQNAHPPVLEDELHVGPRSGRWTDRAALTPALEVGIQERAIA